MHYVRLVNMACTNSWLKKNHKTILLIKQGFLGELMVNTQFTMYVMCLKFLTNVGGNFRTEQRKSSIWVEIRCIKLEV